MSNGQPNQSTDNTTASQDPDKKSTIGYWLKWLPLARKAAQNHMGDSVAAWNEYNKEYSDNSLQIKRANDNMVIDIGYPIYWAACQLLEPAYYSRSPDLSTDKLFGIADEMSLTGELIIERMGGYFKRTSNFDEVMNECTQDFIHCAKTTTQVVYEAALVDKKVRVDLQQIDSGMCDANGQPIPDYLTSTGEHFPKKEEVFKDDKGYFGWGTGTDVDEDSQKINLKSVIYDEILHTPNAKSQSEINEIAYYFCFTREEAEEFFDENIISNFPWKKGKIYNKQQKDDKGNASYDQNSYETPDEYMDGYEIWCKESKTLYWVSENYPLGFLKSPTPDPYQLEHFFPSPAFAIQNKPRKSLFPTPPYIHLRPTVLQLHLMYQRVFGLIDGVRRRAIVDGEDDVVAALNMGDMEFVSAKSLKNIVEKGGLDKMIWYVPVQELVTAISELTSLDQTFVANFDRWFGTPDILQGVSDPIEAEGTQEIKSSAASDRFKNSKKKLQKLARDSLEMMIDLGLYVFSDEKIAQITGYQYMTPEHQQRFLPALQMLRDDETRIIRIDIETDSMTFADQDRRNQRRQQAVQTVMQGIQGIPAMMQLDPIAANIAMQALLLGLDGIDAGKQFEDDVRSLVQKLMDKANQPPPPPPPPDPMIAIKQQELQLEGQKFQAQQAKDAQEMQLKAAAQQFDQQYKSQQLQVTEQIEQANIAIKSQDSEIKGLAVQSKAQADATKNQLDQVQVALQSKIDNATLSLQKFQLIADEKEKLIQEARLDKEQILETIRMHKEHILEATRIANESKAAAQTATTIATATAKQPQATQAPAINIHNYIPKHGKRVGKVSQDASGNTQVEIQDATPDGSDMEMGEPSD